MKMFLDAIRGIVISFKTEKNLKIMLVMGILAIIVGGILNLDMDIILLIVCFVLSGELINTSIERLCDLVHPDESEKVKTIKDIAAGASLINVIISILIGIYLLVDR